MHEIPMNKINKDRSMKASTISKMAKPPLAWSLHRKVLHVRDKEDLFGLDALS